MKYFIADSHNDYLTVLKDFSIKKYLQQNNNIFINSAIFTTELNKPLDLINKYNKFLQTYPNTILSIEDCWFINKANVDSFLQVKPFSCTITWNGKNKLCGGAETDCGFSKWGRNVIKIFSQNRILIDSAHLSHKAMKELFDLIDQPIYNSHSNIYNLCKQRRNLFDYELKLIYLTDGFLGLNLVDYFLSDNEANINNLIEHIDYFVQKFGINNIGFGTDFYGSKSLVLESYKKFYIIIDLLKTRGYTKNDIEKIFSKNFLSFINRCGRYNEKNDF